jgi:hypothetical protein
MSPRLLFAATAIVMESEVRFGRMVLAGGVAGSKIESKNEKRPGQHIAVQLNNGVAEGITQEGQFVHPQPTRSKRRPAPSPTSC